MAWETLAAMGPWFMILLAVIIIWDMIWRGIALWKAGRNNQIAWFVCLFIFSTAGILPIIYLAFFRKKRN